MVITTAPLVIFVISSLRVAARVWIQFVLLHFEVFVHQLVDESSVRSNLQPFQDFCVGLVWGVSSASSVIDECHELTCNPDFPESRYYILLPGDLAQSLFNGLTQMLHAKS